MEAITYVPQENIKKFRIIYPQKRLYKSIIKMRKDNKSFLTVEPILWVLLLNTAGGHWLAVATFIVLKFTIIFPVAIVLDTLKIAINLIDWLFRGICRGAWKLILISWEKSNTFLLITFTVIGLILICLVSFILITNEYETIKMLIINLFKKLANGKA